MLSQTIIIVVLWFLSFAAMALDSISIEKNDEEFTFYPDITFQAPFKPRLAIELELGESLSGKSIRLFSSSEDTFRVSLQLETSMTISAEGAHLDLLNWRHGTTDWIKVEPVNTNIFKLPDFDGVDIGRFPEVSHAEIKEKVLTEGGQEWLDVLNGKGAPEGYDPVSVDLSMVRLKIDKKVDGRWEVITVIYVSVPMGC